MNKYFALRKANRMRTRLLTEKSQEQLKEVIRYLRRVSWDFCGIELVRNDLLDISIQANAKNQELFDSISDAKTFVEEVKPSLKTLRAADYFWFLAPLYFFFDMFFAGTFHTNHHLLRQGIHRHDMRDRQCQTNPSPFSKIPHALLFRQG